MQEVERNKKSLKKFGKPLGAALLAVTSLHASAPDKATLDTALAAARAAWGVTISEPVQLVAEPLNDCDLSAKYILKDVALMQWQDVQTTLRLDDGTSTTTHQLTYVIRVNSACEWTPTWLNAVVLHEYGHVLEGAEGAKHNYHSTNHRSIMYFIVAKDGKQSIMAEDRIKVNGVVANVK